MGKKLNFDEIVRSYQQGGPVAQALPVNDHIQLPENPYTDISDLTKSNTPEIEVDTDLIDKAKGLMGEKKAMYNRIQSLQQEIKAKAATNPLWLETREGMGKLNQLRSIVVVGANDLEQSYKLFDDGKKRVSDNQSENHYIQDLTTGEFIVNDRETGELKRVSRFDFINNPSKYRGIRNNEARSTIEAAATNPSDYQYSIDLKNAMGQTKGSELIVDEINKSLAKAGSTSLNNSTDTFASIRQLKQNPAVKDLIENGNFSPNAVAKLSLTKDEKTNWEHLKETVKNLIDDPNRLSASAKMGLENQIVDKFRRTNRSFESQEDMNKAIRDEMYTTVMNMAVEKREDTFNTDYGVTVDKASADDVPIAYQIGPQEIEIGDWDNVHAYGLDSDTYTDQNKMIPFKMKHTAYNHVDVSGIVVGNDTTTDPEFSKDEARQILENFYATRGHGIIIPVYTEEGNRKGKPAVDALSGENKDGDKYRKVYERIHTNGLKKIDELRKKGAPAEDIQDAGDEMEKNLKQVIADAGLEGKLELRTAMVMSGKIAGDTNFWGTKLGNRLEDVGSKDETSPEAIKIMTGSAKTDTKIFSSTVIVPMVKGVTLDGLVRGDFRERSVRRLGGKLTLQRVGGKLLSFNDIN